MVLFMVSVLNQADTWALPTLQASGLQCSSCAPGNEFYQHCMKYCLELDDVEMGFLTGPATVLANVVASIPFGKDN
jgi:hypothetical protein